MDPKITIEILCNCQAKLGPIYMIKNCEWDYLDNRKCPEVPKTEQKYDWECNPLETPCLPGQYNRAGTPKDKPDQTGSKRKQIITTNNMQNDFVPGSYYNELKEQAPTKPREYHPARMIPYEKLENKVV